MPFYKSLFKKSKDLFGKVDVGECTFSAKGNTQGGTKLTFSGKKEEGKKEVTGNVSWKKNFDVAELENGKVLKVNGSGKFTGCGVLSESGTLTGLADGLELTAGVTLKDACNKSAKNKVNGEVSYEHEKVGIKANVDKVEGKPVELSANVLGKVNDNVSTGLSVNVPLKKIDPEGGEQKVADVNLAGKYSTEDLEVVLSLTDNAQNGNLSVVYDKCSKLRLGAKFTHKTGFKLPFCYKKPQTLDPEDEEKKEDTTAEEKEEKPCCQGRKWNASFAASYKSDDGTYRGVVNDKGEVQISYDFTVKENLSANISYLSNLSNFGKDGSKVGASFTFE